MHVWKLILGDQASLTINHQVIFKMTFFFPSHFSFDLAIIYDITDLIIDKCVHIMVQRYEKKIRRYQPPKAIEETLSYKIDR